jgi:TonB family protein
MVRAIQVNSLGFVEWLTRVRPGVAISVALHIALLLFLAVMLAFPPSDPPLPADRDPSKDFVVEMRQPTPPRIEPPKPKLTPIFQPDVMPALNNVPTTVRPLVLPPVENLDRAPPVVTTATQTPVPVIDKPQPISRGGLVYPPRAAEHDVPGYVDFIFVIEPDGSVGDARVIAETPEGYGFAAAAEKAFTTWRFEPKRVDGKPVAAQARYRISFKSQ